MQMPSMFSLSLIFVALFSSQTWTIVHAQDPASNPLSVSIPAGTIQGASCTNSAARSFLAIPYAQPPIGNQRFASPQPYNTKFPNNGNYDATRPGPACIQFGTTFLESGAVSEDCLYLDVWVPSNATSTSALPVKVWIYGGGEESGGISNALYDGCNLAAHNTLMVSINYRLGPLGFLALDSAGIEGNFGIQDILLGLKWIKDNIAAFGGDPTKLLLFGESAGATNAFIISTLPDAPSLIRALISESGGGRDLATSDVVQTVGANFVRSLNCSTTDISCMRTKSVAELNTKNPVLAGTTIYSSINPNTFQPYVDGKIIPALPSAVGAKVPAIFGSNAKEGNLFVLGQFGTTNITAAQYTTFLQVNFGSSAPLVAQRYNLSTFPAFSAIATIITEVSYKCPAYRALRLSTNQNHIPAYTYFWNHTPRCSWQPSTPQRIVALVGATHTSEIPFVMGNLHGLPGQGPNCTFTPQESSISETLIAAWSGMAVGGDPNLLANGQGKLPWPAWNESTSLGWVVDNSTRVGHVDYSACEFWDNLDTTLLNFSSTANGASASTGASVPAPTASTPSPTATGTSGAAGRSIDRITAVILVLLQLGLFAM